MEKLLFSSLVGAVIGALLTVFALPYLSQQGWLPYNLQVIEARGGQGAQQGGTVRNVSVNVNNEVTQMVSKVSDSVVGVINIQRQVYGMVTAKREQARALFIKGRQHIPHCDKPPCH
ncbi:hypothetical protein PO124_01975 [Bacillus licheniformis]|nr:hypothetical protein [Bacillus licheniformis]